MLLFVVVRELHLEQRTVIIKYIILSKCNFKAGVPHGSSSIVFLIYIINDIADDMPGLCRLYAVDKSVGEKSFEINNLRSIWLTLIKKYHALGETVASQTKPRTIRIVQFSTRPSPVHLYFSIDNIKIKPVDAHKHLGVTHSADGKWSNDIHNVVIKASRQIVILRKIRFKVSRNLLKIFAKSSLGHFLNVIVKFGTVVLLSMLTDMRKFNLKLLESPSSYAETGWEKCYIRSNIRKMSFFYDTVNNDTPLSKVLIRGL